MNVGDLTVQQLVGAVAGAYAGVKLGCEILKFIKDKLNGYYNIRKNNEKKDESVIKHDEAIEKLARSQELQSVALRMILCNDLNERYLKYRRLGYIPDNEFDEYCDMHTAYNGIGGNHTGDSKFEWAINHLERKIED